MGSLAALTAGLALAVGVLVVSNAELVYRLTDSYSNLCPTVPYATVTAPSRFVCSAQCNKANPECNAFQYLADGTCQLFRISGGGEATGGATADPERPTIFLQLSASSCPGTASDECACPPGFTRCAGRCLARLFTDRLDHTSAEAACAALGAHLAVPRSEAENQCIRDAAQAAYDMTGDLWIRVWLGVTDIITNGTFVGADAPCSTAPLPLNSSWWLDGEPSGSNSRGVDEDCLDFVPGLGWNDDECSATHYPLCQLANCYRPECL